MLKILWIEDDKANIDEYRDDSFDELFSEPIVPTSFKEACEYTQEKLKYDFVIIDIDLTKFSDFNSEYVNKIKEKIKFDPTEAGIVIFTMLLEVGFPKERMLFLTANAGSENNTYDKFKNYFDKALMPLPEYIVKDDDAPRKLTETLESRIIPYLTLRRGIIKGCEFLKSHIEKDERNIQFRDFIKKENNHEIATTDIKNYLDTLAQFFLIKQPNDQTALNAQYRLFLRTLVHEWEENIDPQTIIFKIIDKIKIDKRISDIKKVKSTPEYKFEYEKVHDIHTFAWLSKQTRNWASHANLLEPLNHQTIAFLFMVNMRAMFKLPKATQPYEEILLSCISTLPIDNLQNLDKDIKYAEDCIDGILNGLNINETGHFGNKINAIYRQNTGNPDAEEHDFKQFLLQYFWVNQKFYLKNLTADSNDFLPKLARHIYKHSFFFHNMRIIAKKSLRDFWEQYPDAQEPLEAWYYETLKSDWSNPQQIKNKFRNASIIADNRVVFNIKGNDYRLIVKINYPYRVVYIRFIGTHKQYDNIEASKV